MNCVNHPEIPVSAYCQNCGRPLCTQCVRSVAGVVYCEPCLAARLNPGAASPYNTPGAATAGSAAWSRVPDGASFAASGGRSGAPPSPVLAGFLGAIPGVGAMYNGQFVKAFAHVIIFVILVSISDHFDAAGILVAAWIFYQIFDAVQTAIARREGRPLPDPFGLNDLGQRLGGSASTSTYVPPPAQGPVGAAGQSFATETAPGSPFAGSAASGTDPSGTAPSGTAPSTMPSAGPSREQWAHRAAPTQANMGVPATGGAPGSAPLPPSVVPSAPYGARPEPVGAIVLIAVGMLFLLSTLGVFRLDWLGHGWPVLIIALGAWLLFRNMRTSRRAGGGL